MQQFESLLGKLSETLRSIEKQNIDLKQKAEQSIAKCYTYLQLLKEHVVSQGFKSKTHEIHFFKSIKPIVLSKLFYNTHLRKLESGKALYANQTLVRYYEKHLELIEAFARENESFIHYYRSGSTYLDRKYFVRYIADYKMLGEPQYFTLDPSFSTLFDHKVAELQAYEEFAKYLSDAILCINNPNHRSSQPELKLSSNLTWTESKVSAVELIYALYSSRSINAGNVEIAEIAEIFEKVFNLELGDYYRKYLEIKSRKVSSTKFLDHLRQSLTSKIAEEFN